MPQTLVVAPDASTHTVGFDAIAPITFSATLSPSGTAAPAVTWSSDHPELGAIDPRTGVFTPSGAAGTLTVTVTSGDLTATTTLTIVVTGAQEGDPEAGTVSGGAGGVGGVGGEGGGTAITDPGLRAALDATPTTDAELAWLYPYDGTVWPRGLPAPLLQWRHGAHAPLAIRVHVEVDDAFVYDGYFGPPTALAAGSPITHLPIPQKVWRNALYSGANMRVSLTIAASDGAGGYAAFVPSTQLAWTIAPGSLKGTVYYNSYGSKLAQQMGAMGGGRFGGATLAIQGMSFDPVLVAGATTDDDSGCRVCHTVSGDGSLMVVQQADNMASSAYALTNNNTETVFPSADDGKFGWAALSPDGALALGNAGPPGSNGMNLASLDTSALYRVADGVQLTAQGLSEFVTQAATPVFSGDGSKVAFNAFAGPGTTGIAADGRSLVVMDFRNVDPTTYALENPISLFTATGADQRPGWPFFLPDGSGLVFQLELARGGDEIFVTRNGARGELWWVDMAGQSHPLARANGDGYLPTGTDHEVDDELNYEPTVAPIVAGGYAWVVFTSRRMYGNVATRNPLDSDPRYVDLTEGNPGGPTTKKLWVAAIDIPPRPGTDPSHPAFYLPAQELYAGNSRGFWVPQACQANGMECESGDECCGGFCRANSEGVYVCTDELPPETCSMEYESCEVDADCCVVPEAPLSCIGGRCAQTVIY